MFNKYFWHALVVTAVATVFSWSSMFDDVGNSGSGSSWSSGRGSYGGYSGGHK